MSRRLRESGHQPMASSKFAIFLTLFIGVSFSFVFASQEKLLFWAASVMMKVVYPNSQWFVKHLFEQTWIMRMSIGF